MKKAFSSFLLLSLPTLGVLVTTSSVAFAQSAQDIIRERTASNRSLKGSYYTLTQDDSLFYEGDASSSYRIGSIRAGQKVEVLKMNKYMARVRLSDGRVLFVRNRLLKPTSGSGAPMPPQKPTPTQADTPNLKNPAKGIGDKASVRGGRTATIPLPLGGDEASSHVAAATPTAPAVPAPPFTPAPVVAPSGTLASTGTTAPTIKTEAPAAKADAVASAPLPSVVHRPAETTKGDAAVPVPPRRPKMDTPALPATVKTPAKETTAKENRCNPKQEWQSPLRQSFKVSSCIASSRSSGRQERLHAGLDLTGSSPGQSGMPVMAVASGRVLRSGFFSGYGCIVIIQHDSCPSSTGRLYSTQRCTTRYAHMQTKTITRNGHKMRVCDVPAEGSRVTACSPIGKVSGTGASGRANDYPAHLHFEMRDDSESVVFNPLLALPALTRSPHYLAGQSKRCESAAKTLAYEVEALNEGRIEVRLAAPRQGVQ